MAISDGTLAKRPYNNPNLFSTPNQPIVDYHTLEYEKFYDDVVPSEVKDPSSPNNRRQREYVKSGVTPVFGNEGPMRWKDPMETLANFGRDVKNTLNQFGQDLLKTVMDGLMSSMFPGLGKNMGDNDKPVEALWELFKNAQDGQKHPGPPMGHLYTEEYLNRLKQYGLPWMTDARDEDTTPDSEPSNMSIHINVFTMSHYPIFEQNSNRYPQVYKINIGGPTAGREWERPNYGEARANKDLAQPAEPLNPIFSPLSYGNREVEHPHSQLDRTKSIPAGSNDRTPENRTVLQMIHDIGPDFIQNKFDAYLMWDWTLNGLGDDMDQKLEDPSLYNSWITPYEKYILSRKGFAVRFGKLTVPPAINKDFSLNFLETTVHKIQSDKQMTNKANFTLRLDQNLIWLDKIDELSGRKHSLDETIPTEEASHPYLRRAFNAVADGTEKRESFQNQWRVILKTLSKTWPLQVRSRYDIKRPVLYLIIKMVHLSNWINPKFQHPNLPYFVFEDIRFVGPQGNLTYDRNNASPLSMSIDFIYKRQFQINHGYIKSDSLATPEFVYTTNDTRAPSSYRFGDVPLKGKGIPQIPIHDRYQGDWANISPHAAESADPFIVGEE